MKLATVVFLLKDSQIILAKKKNHIHIEDVNLEKSQGIYNGYGGKMQEDDQTILDTAIRELKEETNGVVAEKKDLKEIGRVKFYWPGNHSHDPNMLVHFYFLEKYLGDTLETETMSAGEMFDFQNIPYNKMMTGDEIFLPKMFQRFNLGNEILECDIKFLENGEVKIENENDEIKKEIQKQISNELKIKAIFFFFILNFILNIQNTLALQIKQVSGAPASGQWIEIFNESDSVVDITGYKLLDSGAAINGHGISLTKIVTDFLIPTKSYFILAKDEDRSILAGVNCKVFRSLLGIKLNDDIILKNSSGVQQTNYKVNSLTELNSTNCALNSNQNTSSNVSTSTSTSSTSSAQATTNIVYVYVNNTQNRYGEIRVLLPETKEVPALAEVDYTVKAIDNNKNVINGLDFEWSFGDGAQKFGKDVSYHYIYPGEYTVIASADGYNAGGQAKMKVKVFESKVSILKVGNSLQENFLELKNDSQYDIYLSNFYLRLDGQDFKLPKNLVIEKNSSAKITGQALGFKLPAINVALLYPNKGVMVEYKQVLVVSATSTSQVLPQSHPQPLPTGGEKIQNSGSKKIMSIKKISTSQNSALPPTPPIRRRETQNTDQKLKNNLNTLALDTKLISWFKNLLY